MRDILQNNSTGVLQITVPGKWILAGEHAVLRGTEALVFPLHSKYLRLEYTPQACELDLDIDGEHSSELELTIWSVIEKSLKMLELRRSQMTGRIRITSCIALGGGMGASATLCVALTEWLFHMGHIPQNRRFDFARELENLFHGESSGVDVAVTLMKKPLIFTREKGFSELTVNHTPQLYLSYSGERGVTKDCIEKVKELFRRDPQLAQKIDLQMAECVESFKQLLFEKKSLIEWMKSIKKSNNCFEQWGLVTETVKNHQKTLLDAGALAVKLTGSGGGGYVLSLWENPPPAEMPFEMIACFG